MNLSSRRATVTLEDRLFKNSIYVGLFVFVILLIYDVFVTGDYHSVIIECFGIIYFSYNLRILLKRNSSSRHRIIFTSILFIIVNVAWITGGGISLLLAAILFLTVEFILVVNEAKNYRGLVIALIINYLILFCVEYFFHFNLAADFLVVKEGIIKQYVIVFMLIFFGGYFTVFLKVKYNKERANLNLANEMLKRKSEKVLDQNEQLIISKETLDNQKKELIAIKETLEDKVRDRTNDLLKVNERLLTQNQQLEQYAYITSHNLRAPIAQIKGLVQLLPRDKKFDNQTKETLRRLEGSTESIENVFADLSTILNVKKNLQKPLELVDFIKEIDKVIVALDSTIKENKITVYQPNVGKFLVKALKPYVFSIFHNIIENAVKYSDDSKDNSFIKIELTHTDNHHLVSISDNGIGIDMEMASGKVFQMYQRFNNTHPGQGFGLFLVKSQIEAMGGMVDVDSILGHGTTFNLYFLKG